MSYTTLSLLLLMVLFLACSKESNDSENGAEQLTISYVYIGGTELNAGGSNGNISPDAIIEIRFDQAVDPTSAKAAITVVGDENRVVETTFSFFSDDKLVKLDHPNLDENSSYRLRISNQLQGKNKESFPGAEYSFTTLVSPLVLESVWVDGEQVNPLGRVKDISRKPVIELRFDSAIEATDVSNSSTLNANGASVGYNIEQIDEKTVSCVVLETLDGFAKSQFIISSSLENLVGKPFVGLDLNFYTEADTTPKYPLIPDEELLTLVQEQTFKYFWDFAHPVSGLARERNTSGNTVTTGGSGFGVMAIIVGMERGFISRQQGIGRLETIVDFLSQADRFHGAWPHWMNGETGKTIPFSEKDNGGDLVETAFMIQGLLAARQYLNAGVAQEAQLISKINALWEAVEWDWYTRDGEEVLYWHWSPDYGWEMNHKITGWNEALIIYVLAASSPSHPIDADVYKNGWSRNGAMVNTSGNSYYGYTLPLRSDKGGPLFFAHYSFLGLDPRNLSDQFANYWEQNVTHSKINHAYCADNPLNYIAYTGQCWGLTASDGFGGYSAHSPDNDRGVITPTAALSSMPYTPGESMEVLRYFYYTLGDKLWGEYGFYDAFDLTNGWIADSYLAIDQGPIVVMIENYRSGLLWELFMEGSEVKDGLTKLGFNH